MLSLQKALEDCIKIWSELAVTGEADKAIEVEEEYLNGCPLCQYVFENAPNGLEHLDCTLCPVQWIPGEPNHRNCPCEDRGTVYWVWCFTSDKEVRKGCAELIAKVAENFKGES